MFSKKDYLSYFEDLESIFSKDIVLLTDMLYEISDHAIHSKFFAISLDDIRIFDEIQGQKEKFKE